MQLRVRCTGIREDWSLGQRRYAVSFDDVSNSQVPNIFGGDLTVIVEDAGEFRFGGEYVLTIGPAAVESAELGQYRLTVEGLE